MPKFQITYFENATKFTKTNYPPKLLKSNADRRRCSAKQYSANDSYCGKWLLSDSSKENDGESGEELEGDENAKKMHADKKLEKVFCQHAKTSASASYSVYRSRVARVGLRSECINAVHFGWMHRIANTIIKSLDLSVGIQEHEQNLSSRIKFNIGFNSHKQDLVSWIKFNIGFIIFTRSQLRAITWRSMRRRRRIGSRHWGLGLKAGDRTYFGGSLR